MELNASGLWLDPIPTELRALARHGLDQKDVVGFLCRAPNTCLLDLVSFSVPALQERMLYEPALLHALTATRTNNAGWPMRDLRWLIAEADRSRLRAAGDPIPGPGPFTVYRGVAGHEPARRVRGLSWSASAEKAQWFAERFGLFDPAVYRVTVPRVGCWPI